MSSAANGNRKKSTFAENRKKTEVTNGVRRTSKQNGSTDCFSQTRIKELEEQVSDLKKRLEELRKAKSTTIIKKDKTYVASGAPHKLCDNATKRTAELHDSHRQGTASLESTEKNEERSQQDVENQQDYIARLKEMHRAEIEELRMEVEKQAKQSDSTLAVELEKNAVELEKISKQNAELLEENEKLKLKTTELELRVHELLEELSRKEAEWCSKEEQLLLQVKTSWGEKYQKWMAQTEQKIEELTAANNFLKGLLDKEKT